MNITCQSVYRLFNNFLASSIACEYKKEQKDTMFLLYNTIKIKQCLGVTLQGSAAEQIMYGFVMFCPLTLQLVQLTDERENQYIYKRSY